MLENVWSPSEKLTTRSTNTLMNSIKCHIIGSCYRPHFQHILRLKPDLFIIITEAKKVKITYIFTKVCQKLHVRWTWHYFITLPWHRQQFKYRLFPNRVFTTTNNTKTVYLLVNFNMTAETDSLITHCIMYTVSMQQLVTTTATIYMQNKWKICSLYTR